MRLDLLKLRPGDAIAGASGFGLLCSMFLFWYGRPFFPGAVARHVPSIELTAWRAFSGIDVVLTLTAVAGLALAVLNATRRAPALPLVWAVFTTVIALVATILVIVVLIDPPGANGATDVNFAAYLGLAATIGVFYGAYRSLRDEGMSWIDSLQESQRLRQLAATARRRPPDAD